MLFIGTPFSNLYTALDTPAKGRVGVCVVFVFVCKYVLGHSRVSQLPNSGYASSGTLAFIHLWQLPSLSRGHIQGHDWQPHLRHLCKLQHQYTGQ